MYYISLQGIIYTDPYNFGVPYSLLCLSFLQVYDSWCSLTKYFLRLFGGDMLHN